jgi:orotidine-5'-phosphate decarboxylase
MSPRDKLAFALDEPTLQGALPLLDLVAPEVGVVKIGLELFVREGPAAVHAVRERGARVFLDLKLHDIPRTVGAAARSAADLDVELLTVHAAGGSVMLREAVRATAGRCRILAVTVLTSLDVGALASIGVPASPVDWALRLGGLAMAAGCGGIVCSPEEAAAVRAHHPDAYLVTPGIRTERGQDDQVRVSTPEAAVRAGADLLVVGRPIRDAPDPRAAARAIVERIGAAGTGR